MHFSLSQSASTNQVWWPFVYLSPRTAKEPSTVYAGVILFLALLLFCYFISIKPLCSPYWPTQYDLKHLNKIVLISYSATRTSQSTEQCVIWIKVNPIVHSGHVIHSRRSLRCVKWRNKVNFLTLSVQESPTHSSLNKSRLQYRILQCKSLWWWLVQKSNSQPTIINPTEDVIHWFCVVWLKMWPKTHGISPKTCPNIV